LDPVRDYLASFWGVVSICFFMALLLMLVIYFTWGRWYERPIGRHRAGVVLPVEPVTAPPAPSPDRWERHYRINPRTLKATPLELHTPFFEPEKSTALIRPGWYFDEVAGVVRFYDEFGRPVDWSEDDQCWCNAHPSLPHERTYRCVPEE
jgi:hypothetical protein